MFELLKTFSWQELRQHPWRNAAAVLAVMLGVALAFSVHLINSSALDEFAQAARSVGGQSDLELRGVQGHFDERLFKTIAQTPGLAVASPLLEVGSYVMTAQGKRSLRVVGVDALSVFGISPDLMPIPQALAPSSNQARQMDRWALFAPGQIFLNAAARRIALPEAPANPPAAGALKLQSGMQWLDVNVAGSVRASGPALAVMDLGAAQDLFDKPGQLTRIDLRLQPGVNREAFARQLQDSPGWPLDVTVALPQEAQSQINNLSRAYRVNLTVLALIALFTGAFLVFSVLSLSVAKRAQQFALLGVLGLSGRNRLKLVLWESLFLGLMGSGLGLALGTALAALALGLLGGDLGSGFFSGATPSLQFSPVAALIYGALGVAAALVGGWWPARAAQLLPPAQTLKGLGNLGVGSKSHWISLFLIAVGALLTWAPPVFGIPLAAYIAIGMLLVGGITALPWLIGLLLGWLAPRLSRQTLPLLAVERARRQRDTAAVAVSGVVAALSLAVALTVMVASFRDSVISWLDRILPADLYVRSAAGMGASDTVYFSPEFVLAAAKLQGVQKLQPQRMVPLSLQASLPAVALLARDLGDPAQSLPLLEAPLPVPPGMIGVYVSQAVVDLYGAQAGQTLPILSKAFRPLAHTGKAPEAIFFVAGVWRDYARQSGSIAIDLGDFQRLTGDRRANDLALWLSDTSNTEALQKELQALAERQSGQASGQRNDPAPAPSVPAAPGNTVAGDAGPSVGGLLEFGTSAQIRAISLKIFDRSFAVTYWLQSVAIAIGLFGIAASFSAQVLSRRKEFGLLAHLGLTRRQILTVVALEGTAWTTLGAIAGLALGLVVAVVLVHVVNPQSFHWTMDLMLPWQKLLALCLAVVAAGTVTAWLAARAAAGKDAVMAVKEDW